MSLEAILKEIQDKFDILDIGYTEESVPMSLPYYEEWIDKEYHGPLKYLSDERMKVRSDLKNYYPKFESALVFLFSYQKTKKNEKDSKWKVASYVNGFEGVDYHIYIRERLSATLEKLKILYPDIEGVFSLDTQPILERDMAYRAGLGWFGKNAMLINKKEGSYFIIGSLLLNQKLPFDKKEIETDHCGNCTRCIDACPTNAIISDKVVDSKKCISTFTIELFKEAPAPQGFEKTNQIFGCDICQEVCPWNKKPLRRIETSPKQETPIERFFLNRDVEDIVDELESMSNREFRRKFKGTPMERTGRVGLLKNLRPFKSN